ncbi:hypothetical protein [Nonomuraea sp. NPDC049480]|uniref:hypothetical protein n=1 Tax=Nonomuraea sp. NPDC049480 TaxID=3364353 RepID=UPI0037AD1B6C
MEVFVDHRKLSRGAELLVEAADAVLIVGSRANSTDTNGCTAPPRDAGIKIAQIDADASRVGRNFPPAACRWSATRPSYSTRYASRCRRQPPNSGDAPRRAHIPDFGVSIPGGVVDDA